MKYAQLFNRGVKIQLFYCETPTNNITYKF